MPPELTIETSNPHQTTIHAHAKNTICLYQGINRAMTQGQAMPLH